MIDLGELHDFFRLVGPREQLYFIDACRSQSTLYGVAELGEVGGTPGGNGFLTKHLVQALRGRGAALDYDPGEDRFAVTPESVRTYVQRRVQELIDANPDGLA
jgi:hypothetical protein